MKLGMMCCIKFVLVIGCTDFDRTGQYIQKHVIIDQLLENYLRITQDLVVHDAPYLSGKKRAHVITLQSRKKPTCL